MCRGSKKKNIIQNINDVQDDFVDSNVENEIDFEKIEKFKRELGQLGEEFVYNYERKKLEGTNYYNLVDKTKAYDPKNGYDILSYSQEGEELFIEVKTTLNNLNEFYITENELETARRLKEENKTYLIYRVRNIRDSSDAELDIIENLDNGKYNMKPLVYVVYEK